MKFLSSRSIPLITQCPSDVPLLTVENYCKWYEIYLIPKASDCTNKDCDRSDARSLYTSEYDTINDNIWYDHCIIPEAFVSLCIALGAKCDLATYNAICARFMSDYLQLDGYYGSKEYFSDIITSYTPINDMITEIKMLDYFPTTDNLKLVLLEEDQVVLN